MDTRKPDIFDRLMHLPVLNIFEPFYKKHKEMLLYLFFGGLTFVISVITYAFFNVSLGMNELVANIFSWILAVLFAFFTNRLPFFCRQKHILTNHSICFFNELAELRWLSFLTFFYILVKFEDITSEITKFIS